MHLDTVSTTEAECITSKLILSPPVNALSTIKAWIVLSTANIQTESKMGSIQNNIWQWPMLFDLQRY